MSDYARQLVMQEVLARPDYEKLPRAEWEFYELCIEESDDVWRPGFVVKQTRAQWIEIDQQVMWEEPEWERWPTLKTARGCSYLLNLWCYFFLLAMSSSMEG